MYSQFYDQQGINNDVHAKNHSNTLTLYSYYSYRKNELAAKFYIFYIIIIRHSNCNIYWSQILYLHLEHQSQIHLVAGYFWFRTVWYPPLKKVKSFA